jgi:DNA polymerase I
MQLAKGRRLYYDTEANNLLPKVTTFHCAGFVDLDSGEEFYFGPPVPATHPLATPILCRPTGPKEACLEFLASAFLAVAHNGLDYDARMLKKLYPERYAPPLKEWDSYIMVKLLWPADSLIGPDMRGMLAGRFPGQLLKSHSLKAWGYRLGNLKDDYKGGFEEWNPEMASYMMQDVSTGVTLWKRCLLRLGWPDTSGPSPPLNLSTTSPASSSSKARMASTSTRTRQSNSPANSSMPRQA